MPDNRYKTCYYLSINLILNCTAIRHKKWHQVNGKISFHHINYNHRDTGFHS